MGKEKVFIKNMEMPKGCRVCKFCQYNHINHWHECIINDGNVVSYSYKKRDEECPLKECE